MSPGIHSKIGIPDNSITVESCSRERETKSNKKKKKKETSSREITATKIDGGRSTPLLQLQNFLSRCLSLYTAKRTNQAEGCYQNFRLRDKLNYCHGSSNDGEKNK